MVLLHCDFGSDVLGIDTAMTVLLPRSGRGSGAESGSGGDGIPVLYLLHGLGDDHAAWTRRTAIERYVEDLGLAVVMPRAGQSFYADEVHGLPYWTFLTQELPEVVAGMFRVSTRREDTFVAGLSMGGYGALKWALREPESFAAAASLSGCLDLAHPFFRQERAETADRVFGPVDIAGGGNDLLALVAGADVEALPDLYVACGEQDELFEANRAFLDTARRAGVPCAVDLGPGAHDWDYWERGIRDVLDWLPLEGR